MKSFEEFKIEKPVCLSGGMSGRIDGSRTHQGISYVDVSWENGTTTCDLPGSCYNDGGGDAALGTTIHMGY